MLDRGLANYNLQKKNCNKLQLCWRHEFCLTSPTPYITAAPFNYSCYPPFSKEFIKLIDVLSDISPCSIAPQTHKNSTGYATVAELANLITD